MTVQNYKSKLTRGFTLIELLIVMAILGVLAVVVLVAINPVQQLARTRDAGRKAGVAQIGHAVEAYYTARGGTYPPAAGTGCTPANWLGCIVEAGELSTSPQEITYATATQGSICTTNEVNGWCYDDTGGDMVVFSILESDSEWSKCTTGTPYFVWSSADGRGGLVCGAAAPSAGNQTFNAIQ